MILAVALALLGGGLAGCLDDEDDAPTYGHLLTVQIEGEGFCSVTGPAPLRGGAVWDDLEVVDVPDLEQGFVTTEHGPAFQVNGTGNFTGGARAGSDAPVDDVELSLRAAVWESFSGGLRAVFRVHAVDCGNDTRLTVNWLRDTHHGIEAVTITGAVDDGWHTLPGVRTLVEN